MTILKLKTPLCIICISLLTGCLTSKKVNRQVAKQYSSNEHTQKKQQNDFISVTSGFTSDSQISTTETKTSNVLPLLVYWSWDYNNTCTLNPQIPVNNFATTVLANKGLKTKLAGRKLELSVEKIPNRFVINDKAHLIFVGYAFGWDNVSIKAENMDMVVSYKLTKESSEGKSGTITIPYGNDKKNLGMFKSWKTTTTEYLDDYDATITSMSKLVIENLYKVM